MKQQLLEKLPQITEQDLTDYSESDTANSG